MICILCQDINTFYIKKLFIIKYFVRLFKNFIYYLYIIMSAIFNLLANIVITGTSIIGFGTIINKIGKFCKIIEENKKDGFKLGFDSVMLESINDMNNCVESVSTISTNLNKIIFIIYDLSIGNKFIKKDKDGKIIVCNKLKVYSGFKEKINELNSKVKKYEQELSKIKKNKKPNKKSDEDSENKSSDRSYSSNESSKKDEDQYSDISSEEVSDNETSNKKLDDDEFLLES